MTEAEWLTCGELETMLAFLNGRVSQRKLRLFACACCRSQGDVLQEAEIQKALAAAERYADGEIRPSTACTWHKRASAARDRLPGASPPRQREAYFSVIQALSVGDQGAWRYPWVNIVIGIANESGHPTSSPQWETARREAMHCLAPLLRDISGNPFHATIVEPRWLSWEQNRVPQLALGIYLDRAFDRLPILADALEEAGCTDLVILGHLRSPGRHVRGCWAVDLVLGKE